MVLEQLREAGLDRGADVLAALLKVIHEHSGVVLSTLLVCGAREGLGVVQDVLRGPFAPVQLLLQLLPAQCAGEGQRETAELRSAP